VCVGCATGCNAFTDFDPRTQEVHRYRPRENLEVNQYWMCDEGMLDYRRVREHRTLYAKVSGEKTTREAALDKAFQVLERANPETTAVVLSAEHSQEDNFALLELARDVLKVSQIFITGRPQGEGDKVLKDSDRNPNGSGVRRLSPQARSFAEMILAVEAGSITHVVALGSQTPAEAPSLARVQHLVALTTHEGPFAEHAEVLLPAASFAEAHGTFVNRNGLVQQSERAITPRGDSRPAFRWVHELRQLFERPPAWRKLEELRAAMKDPAAATRAGEGARP
jgi:NADH-quinone oxidoreductase subunit G